MGLCHHFIYYKNILCSNNLSEDMDKLWVKDSSLWI